MIFGPLFNSLGLLILRGLVGTQSLMISWNSRVRSFRDWLEKIFFKVIPSRSARIVFAILSLHWMVRLLISRLKRVAMLDFNSFLSLLLECDGRRLRLAFPGLNIRRSW